MSQFTKALAVAAALAVGTLAGAATAATLSISGGTTTAVPSNYNPHPNVVIPGNTFTRFKAASNNGLIGGGVMLDGPARVTYTFLGQEAGAENTIESGTLMAGSTALFTNRAAPGTAATVRASGGFLDFLFRTSGLNPPKRTPAIQNGGRSENKDLVLLFSSIFNNGRSVITSFDDGRRDFDHDDMLVQIDVAPVPVPAAGVLLVGALGAMGALRRRRRA